MTHDGRHGTTGLLQALLFSSEVSEKSEPTINGVSVHPAAAAGVEARSFGRSFVRRGQEEQHQRALVLPVPTPPRTPPPRDPPSSKWIPTASSDLVPCGAIREDAVGLTCRLQLLLSVVDGEGATTMLGCDFILQPAAHPAAFRWFSTFSRGPQISAAV